MSEKHVNMEENVEFQFLDDIDVDEIVKLLNYTDEENHSQTTDCIQNKADTSYTNLGTIECVSAGDSPNYIKNITPEVKDDTPQNFNKIISTYTVSKVSDNKTNTIKYECSIYETKNQIRKLSNISSSNCSKNNIAGLYKTKYIGKSYNTTEVTKDTLKNNNKIEKDIFEKDNRPLKIARTSNEKEVILPKISNNAIDDVNNTNGNAKTEKLSLSLGSITKQKGLVFQNEIEDPPLKILCEKESHLIKKLKPSLHSSASEVTLKEKGAKSLKVSEQINDHKNITKTPKDEIKCTLEKGILQHKVDMQFSEKIQRRLYKYLQIKTSNVSFIHQGKFSRIFKCKHMGRNYAIKIINDNLNIKRLGLEKKSMLQDLQCGMPKNQLFCIYLLESFSLEKHYCFLFDYYPKNLREELNRKGPMHIDSIQNLSSQLIAAVTSLRTHNIIHSNIKPEHLLLNNSSTILKLCGFDSSYYVSNVYQVPNIGTASYRAPEIILGYSNGFSIDVWSTGLIMYEMATNHKLFSGHYNNDILYKQMSILGNIPFSMIKNSIYGCNHFVGRRFLRKEGYNGKNTQIIHGFIKNHTFLRTLHVMYNNNWRSTNKFQRDMDINKINLLVDLLKKMLVLHPLDRIPIEFVNVDPFIYQTNMINTISLRF